MSRSSKRVGRRLPADPADQAGQTRTRRNTGRSGRRRISIPAGWKWILIAAGVSAAVLVAVVAGGGILPRQLGAEISPAQANQEISGGAMVLDVRTRDEFVGGHIENSLWIPLDELSSRLDVLPRDRRIITVCRSGVRSAEARDILRGAGFSEVTSLAGGLQAWVAAGYPTVAGEP